MKRDDLVNLELQIEELILHGFAPGDRTRIGESVQQELTRLLTEAMPDSLAQGRAIDQINDGTFEMALGMKPEAVGVQIAQSIYGGLKT
ncbi:MAG TPA: hypothetical protein V6C84_29925 [Coleofasciculaceae cyanobacterium]|jgi:hypothetical protein